MCLGRHLRALITLEAVHALRAAASPLALQTSAAGQSVPVQVGIIKLLARVPQALFGCTPALVYWHSAAPGQVIFLSAAAYLRS